jgi:hypothetical protein
MLDNHFKLFENLNLDLSSKAGLGPVMEIVGDGEGWAKETNGSVVIHPVPGRTTVEVSGPGGWKITGPETIG